ncbi:MAG: DUF4097 family beta strand repeat-containing protein [Bacteroidales bacterium]
MMKTSVFNKKAIVLFLAVIHITMNAAGQEAEKTMEKLFPLTGKASLEIENRYGSIDIRNWDKDEISIEVQVKVTASKQETADRQLSYIEVNFSQQENAVSAVTEIDQRISRQRSGWFSSGDNGQNISIDYTVYAPRETDLNITHRYGDIFINEATGHTFIDLRYGNLLANSIIRNNTRPLSEINLAYSTKATITEAEWLQVNMRYSDLVVNRCQALVVSASYSKLRVDQASSVVSESRYGEFNMGEIRNFVTESAYTNYSINKIEGTLDVESKYGNVRIDNIPADFSKIRFISTYGNLHAGIDPRASYTIESSASYGSVNIPDEEKVNRIASGRQTTLSGVVGTDAQPDATVEISIRYGNADLRGR